MCATARLFIDHMLPDIDAGIFLDTDILLMDNIKVFTKTCLDFHMNIIYHNCVLQILWNYFKKFSPVQVKEHIIVI